jgi:hypothetical protein
MTGVVDMLPSVRNTEKAIVTKTEITNDYTPEESFYSGNGKLISGDALQNLAETLFYCMSHTRKAFGEILDSLDMPDDDRAYYKWVAGVEK